MAQYIVQSDRNITVRYQSGNDAFSFRLSADNGVPFIPNTIVSIADERLDGVARKLAESIGYSNIQRLPDDYEITT